ncbi:MAG: hypothetical protein CYPHOPRED_002339 [Cyphobasidiales sp. Tagirdzhanova-0007]|nr:MAG: hypothetical protein CYPHOPRED_002339 [Cyphobasidiales sp. Tagirdzhanova-0007]
MQAPLMHFTEDNEAALSLARLSTPSTSGRPKSSKRKSAEISSEPGEGQIFRKSRKGAPKTHASKACNGCRRRKVRCDGRTPTCSTCTTYEDECLYDLYHDARKPPSREYVGALQQRIRILEHQLDTIQHVSREESESASAPGRFKVVKRGHVVTYGPTSAYMHMTEDPDYPEQRLMPGHTVQDSTYAEKGVGGTLSDAYSSDGEAEIALLPARLSSQIPGWKRFLPPGIGIPGKLHDELLAYFFSYVNPFTFFVDERRFMRDMERCTSETTHVRATAFYSPILHNVLLALGSKYSKDLRIQSAIFQIGENGLPLQKIPLEERGRAFAQNARDVLEGELNHPLLSTVTGCMLLGTWHQMDARPTLGWIYEGIGIRLAFTLGLHMNGSDLLQRKVLSHELKRARDHCFATVAFQDQIWSYTLGRIPSVRSTDAENLLPPIISQHLDSLDWQSYPPGLTMPGQLSTVLHYAARLTNLAERIHAINYSTRSTLSATAKNLARSEIHIKLVDWHRSLPVSCSLGSHTTRKVTPHVIILNIIGWYLVILLFRTQYVRHEQGGTEEAELPATLCNAAASKIISLLKLYDMYVLAASKIYNKLNKRSQAVFEDLGSCIYMLRKIGLNSRHAALSAGVLEQMRLEWLGDIGGTTSSSEQQRLSIDLSKGLGDLTDPASDFARLLTKLGWKPPMSGGAVIDDSSVVPGPAPEAKAPVLSADWDGPASDLVPRQIDTTFLTDHRSDLLSGAYMAETSGFDTYTTLNPQDLALSLHPSALSGIVGDQFADLFPVHWGGESSNLDIEKKIPSGAVERPESSEFQQIDKRQETRLLRKVDLYMIPVFGLVYLFAFLDRGNIGNAKVAGMATDLKLVGNQYGTCVSVVYATYVVFEPIYVNLLKILTPRLLLSVSSLVFGILTLSTAWSHKFTGLVAIRVLLGCAEAGIFPSIVTYFAMTYRREELGRRLSYIFTAAALSGAFGAYGLTNIRSGGLASWQWIYVVEGAPPPNTLSQDVRLKLIFRIDEAWFLSADDRQLCMQRYEINKTYYDPDEHFMWWQVRAALLDWKTWNAGVIQFAADVALYGEP